MSEALLQLQGLRARVKYETSQSDLAPSSSENSPPASEQRTINNEVRFLPSSLRNGVEQVASSITRRVSKHRVTRSGSNMDPALQGRINELLPRPAPVQQESAIESAPVPEQAPEQALVQQEPLQEQAPEPAPAPEPEQTPVQQESVIEPAREEEEKQPLHSTNNSDILFGQENLRDQVDEMSEKELEAIYLRMAKTQDAHLIESKQVDMGFQLPSNTDFPLLRQRYIFEGGDLSYEEWLLKNLVPPEPENSQASNFELPPESAPVQQEQEPAEPEPPEQEVQEQEPDSQEDLKFREEEKLVKLHYIILLKQRYHDYVERFRSDRKHDALSFDEWVTNNGSDIADIKSSVWVHSPEVDRNSKLFDTLPTSIDKINELKEKIDPILNQQRIFRKQQIKEKASEAEETRKNDGFEPYSNTSWESIREEYIRREDSMDKPYLEWLQKGIGSFRLMRK